MLGKHVGELLKGRAWVGVPFAGGLAEVFHLTARTIAVNDRHRHVINLARCVADPRILRPLARTLERLLVHPDELAAAQAFCRANDPGACDPRYEPDLDCAAAYFVCCWMGRSGNAGTPAEFTGGLALRYNAGGGDSAVRYYSAVKALWAFHKTLRRCTYSTDDVFDFLAKCHDDEDCAIYADPPFPEAGRKYTHNPGDGEAERLWHARLAQALGGFTKTRVVIRFYDHPLVREWRLLAGGRTQANAEAPEVLLVSRG